MLSLPLPKHLGSGERGAATDPRRFDFADSLELPAGIALVMKKQGGEQRHISHITAALVSWRSAVRGHWSNGSAFNARSPVEHPEVINTMPTR